MLQRFWLATHTQIRHTSKRCVFDSFKSSSVNQARAAGCLVDASLLRALASGQRPGQARPEGVVDCSPPADPHSVLFLCSEWAFIERRLSSWAVPHI